MSLKILRPLLIVLVCKNIAISNELYLYKCPVSYKIMYLIANNERSKKRSIGYPFLISFNNYKVNSQTIKKILMRNRYKKIDNRTIDCLDRDNCIRITLKLIKAKIINLDLGAFQINYKYHKMNLSKYFSLKESYIKACSILQNIFNKYGYSWLSIAKYHSYSAIHMNKYLKLISKNLKDAK